MLAEGGLGKKNMGYEKDGEVETKVTLQWHWHLQPLLQFWEAQLLPRQSSPSTTFSLRLCLLKDTGFSAL